MDTLTLVAIAAPPAEKFEVRDVFPLLVKDLPTIISLGLLKIEYWSIRAEINLA